MAQSNRLSAKPARLHSLLAYGAGMMAVRAATARGWPVVTPLPFGSELNLAINAQPTSLEDMDQLLAGDEPIEPDVAQRAAEIRQGWAQVSALTKATADRLD